MRTLYLMLTLTMFVIMNTNAQKNDESKEKKVIIIKKEIGDDGKEIVTEIIKKGDEADQAIKEMEIEIREGVMRDVEREIHISSEDFKGMFKDMEIQELENHPDGQIRIITRENGNDEIIEWIERPGQDFAFEELRNMERNRELGEFHFERDHNNFKLANPRGHMEWNEEKKPNVSNNKVLLGVITSNHENGAKIIEVVQGSAADQAGLEEGDIINYLDDQRIYSNNGLIEHLSSYSPGEKTSIKYFRDGKQKKTKVVLPARS